MEVWSVLSLAMVQVIWRMVFSLSLSEGTKVRLTNSSLRLRNIPVSLWMGACPTRCYITIEEMLFLFRLHTIFFPRPLVWLLIRVIISSGSLWFCVLMLSVVFLTALSLSVRQHAGMCVEWVFVEYVWCASMHRCQCVCACPHALKRSQGVRSVKHTLSCGKS